MHYYFAVVHKDEDSAFGVHFPDVPGCFSAADQIDDIVPNAIEALGLYSEDQELPPSRSVDQLRRDPEIAADLSEGAFLVAVPVIENDARVVRASITVESEAAATALSDCVTTCDAASSSACAVLRSNP